MMPRTSMDKAKSTTYPLIIAAMFLAATPLLPCINAQPPAPAPSVSSDCFPYLLNLSDCLSYVQPGSNETEPDPRCCPEISHLVNTKPVCLCDLLSNSTTLAGITIDRNRALTLPSVCRVNTRTIISACAEGPSDRSSAPRNAYNGGHNLYVLVGLAILLFTDFF